MNKQEVYEFLNSKNISYEITEHRAVFHMDEIIDFVIPYPEADAKNLFVRDDKKRQYYLITVRGNKRVDLKAFRNANGTRPLSFASAEDLFALLKLTPGSVSPFGLLNNEEKNVIFCVDSEFIDGLIGCHPNDNTATVWMKTSDLISIVEEHGNSILTVNI